MLCQEDECCVGFGGKANKVIFSFLIGALGKYLSWAVEEVVVGIPA